jgi:predicted glycoside hydrolase/deacetylase ChbG (UPF0249 family)
MKTDRREFIQTMGAGAAGLGLAAAVPSAAAQAKKVTQAGGTRRKMIIRADDVGFSKVCNIGTFETIEKGVVTSADVMLDSPGTEDALERLRAFPWISVGWHGHMWGASVLEPKQVPSLVEKDGQFAGRFKLDLGQADGVVYEEAVKELRAQLDRCIKILGRVPDTGGGGRGNSPWGRACQQVSDEYGLVYGFESRAASDKRVLDKIEAAQKAGEEWAKYYSPTPRPASKPDEKWASRKILTVDGSLAYIDLYTDHVSEVEAKYDPVLYYTEDRAGILKYPDDVIIEQSWHPGYVDYYVYRLGERGRRARAQQFVVGRVQDVAALCDVRLRNWIKENHIELVNYRDALHGTREYQNHLRLIGSDLCMI